MSRLGSIAVLSAALVALSAAPATAGDRAYALGDSVMLGAVSQLAKRGVQVDATVSRQLRDGAGILRSLRAQGRLSGVVVVHLGTNGPFTRSQFDGLMRPVRDRPVIVLTVKMPRSWERSANAVIRAGVGRWANATLVDWHRQATRHPGWLYADGIHLRPGGAAAYAKLVGRTVTAVSAR